MWITNKNNSREITEEMSAAMVDFLSIAIEHGCIGSTFAEDDDRIIVFTRTWWLAGMGVAGDVGHGMSALPPSIPVEVIGKSPFPIPVV